MLNPSCKKIKIQSLNPNHLSLLDFSKQQETIKLFQVLLIKGCLAYVEKKLTTLLPTKNPYCLVAIENKKLVGCIIIKPVNLRGTCWSVCSPKVIGESIFNTNSLIKSSLIKASCEITDRRASHWLMQYDVSDVQGISISREQGFQPLKVYRSWYFPNNYKVNRRRESELPTSLKWEGLNKLNSYELCKLEAAGDSVMMRNIFDRKPSDLINSNKGHCGVLISSEEKKKSGILGLISQNLTYESDSFQLIRDFALDERLKIVLPLILDKLYLKGNHIIIDTLTKDDQLNMILKSSGLKEKNEKILLGKSLWKRKELRESLIKDLDLKTILGNLKPNQTPLPSPTLIPK